MPYFVSEIGHLDPRFYSQMSGVQISRVQMTGVQMSGVQMQMSGVQMYPTPHNSPRQ